MANTKSLSAAGRAAISKSWEEARQLAAQTGKSIKECRAILKARRLGLPAPPPPPSVPRKKRHTRAPIITGGAATITDKQIGDAIAFVKQCDGDFALAQSLIKLVHRAQL